MTLDRIDTPAANTPRATAAAVEADPAAAALRARGVARHEMAFIATSEALGISRAGMVWAYR